MYHCYFLINYIGPPKVFFLSFGPLFKKFAHHCRYHGLDHDICKKACSRIPQPTFCPHIHEDIIGQRKAKQTVTATNPQTYSGDKLFEFLTKHWLSCTRGTVVHQHPSEKKKRIRNITWMLLWPYFFQILSYSSSEPSPYHGTLSPGIESWRREGARFSASLQTGPGARPANSYNGYRVSFPRVKQPEHGIDHHPHLTPRLKKE